MKSKFLVALQYWDGDKEQACKLLDLFAKTITPENEFADLVIFYRADSTPPCLELLEILKIPFSKVWCIKSKNIMQGWPNGCNQLWTDLVMEAYIRSTQSATSKPPEWSEYKAILTIESDSCPIKKSWLKELSEEWDGLQACVVGTWLGNNDEHEGLGHINGNAMFCIDIVKKCPTISGTPCDKAWDTYHAKTFQKAGWASTQKIVSMHNSKTLNTDQYEHLKNTDCVFLHGVKDNSVLEMYLNENSK
jgi:hypothetical protein